MVFLLMGVVPSALCSGDTVGSQQECLGRTQMSESPESSFHTRVPGPGGPPRFLILLVCAGPRNWIPDKCASRRFPGAPVEDPHLVLGSWAM